MSNIVKSPPFLFTYWNPLDQDSSVGRSWFDYVKDTSLAEYTADCVGQYVQQTSDEQIRATERTGRKICGVFYEGFSNLESQLSAMSGQIGEALRGVNQRLDLLTDEAKTSNLLQENMAELLRIPESQKQRQHHIEMGLKFLKNALKDPDLYQDALRELLDAEKLMPSDYFVLHRIGMIYLYVPSLGNIEKALDYFSRAAKYAFVESYPDAARLTNVLNKSAARRFSVQAEASTADLKVHAAESYFQAGTALYALGRFEEAVRMAEKAATCQPDEAKFHFYVAKYLTRTGKTDGAVKALMKATELAPEMALAVVGDFDLNRSAPILNVLEALNDRANTELKDGICRLKNCSDANQLPSILQWLTTVQECLDTGNYPQKRLLLAELADYEELILPALATIKTTFKTFIGQERIKRCLAEAIVVSKRTSQPLGHVLLLGPIGVGKATLAKALAKGTGKRVVSCVPADFTGRAVTLLRDLKEGDVLVVENVDKLEHSPLACLISAIKELKCEIAIRHGDTDVRAATFEIERFTLISTAVSGDAIPRDLLSQFSITEHFDPYIRNDLDSLVRQIAAQMGLTSMGLNPDLAIKSVAGLTQITPKAIFRRLSELQEREYARLAGEAETAASEYNIRREEEKARREKIALLLSAAAAAEATENTRWLRKKDFSRARSLYAEAAALGSAEAEQKQRALPT